ncbi:CbtA family protein [Geodermatophilus sp. URMC 64]
MSATARQRAAAADLSFGGLLGRLALAGLVAGLLSSGWLLLVTERALAPAIAVQQAREAAGTAAPAHEEIFGRGTQVFGGVLGTVLAAVLLGLVFAVVYGLVRHRLPGRTDSARVSLLAAIGFGIVGLLPMLTIPANPPGVGNQDTVSSRTAIYLGVLLCGVVVTMLVAALVSLLRHRGVAAAPTAAAAAALGIALVALLVVLVPDNPDAIPDDVTASIVWDFRLATLGQQAVLWLALGLTGGWLLDRATAERA